MPVPDLIKKNILRVIRRNPNEEFWISKLTRRLGLSIQTVSKYVDELIEEGKLESDHQSKKKLVYMSEEKDEKN